MAKTTARTPIPFRKHARQKSLIEWKDPARQAHVLDWRHRAHEFGLVHVEDGESARQDDEPEEETVTVEPEQLLYEEEPEAFRRQAVSEDNIEEPESDEGQPAASLGREDVTLCGCISSTLASVAC